MLFVVSPVSLQNYDGILLIYDTDDMTAEFHTVDKVAEAVKAGLEFGNAGFGFNRGMFYVSSMYQEWVFEGYAMDGIYVEYIENNCIILSGDSDYFVYNLNDSMGVMTPPIYVEGRLGFYLVSLYESDAVDLHYEWHDMATSPLVKHSKAVYNKVSKMLLFGSDGREVLSALGVDIC